MKNSSWALGAGWILGAVQACGSAEPDTPAEPAEFSSSVAGDKTLESLSANEVDAVCRDVDAFMLQSGLRAETCQVLGVIAAARASVIALDASDAELRAICSDSYEACADDETLTAESCARDGFSESCAASVTEYGACLEGRAREYHAIAQALPRCSMLTAEQLRKTSALTTGVAVGSACETYLTECPGISKAAADFVGEYCGRISSCCSEAGLGDDCQALTLQATLGLHFDASTAEDCLARLEQYQAAPESCSDLRQTFYFSEWSAAIPECEAVFSSGWASVGLPAGAPCRSDEDCAPSERGSARCVPSAHLAASICAPVTKGDRGDPCVGTVAEAYDMLTEWVGDVSRAGGALCSHADNLRCDEQSGTCTGARDLGDACAISLECSSDAYCDQHGVCAARLAEGADCNHLIGECAGAGACDDTSQKCTLPLAAGAACSGDGSTPCASGGCVAGACTHPLAPLCGEPAGR